jgi:hypothetical protein
MSGSALGLFLCRGCRLHFMLRPACSLPAVRLSPPHGLSMPRLGAKVSPQHLGPAIRRTDAFRSGTLTRWTGAASVRHTSPPKGKSDRRVTTHHARSVAPRGRSANAKEASFASPRRVEEGERYSPMRQTIANVASAPPAISRRYSTPSNGLRRKPHERSSRQIATL